MVIQLDIFCIIPCFKGNWNIFFEKAMKKVK